MKKQHLYIVCFSLLAFFSCENVEVRVIELPKNTPPNSRYYLTGNFNYWDPGDQDYELKMNEDSTYSISIPRGYGKLEYKVTRGEFSNIETDKCGYHMNNRVFTEDSDLQIVTIQSWKDLEPPNCGQITFKLKVPENTPDDDPITLAGNFNLWNPQDSTTEFKKDTSTGDYLLTIPKPDNMDFISLKVTRGDLSKSEADLFGNESAVRNMAFRPGDTLLLSVDNWEDMVKPENNRMTIIIENVPANTPPVSDIYMVGNFNSWYPKDNNYMMKYRRGKYFFSIPRQKEPLEYKFTRGSWKSEEVDKSGKTISNRILNFGNQDTVFVEIENWKDLFGTKEHKYIMFEVLGLPKNTPPEDDLYITGNFNNWNPKSSNYRLKKSDGNWFVSIPKVDGVIEYKFTRGGWETEEVNHRGKKIQNRTFKYTGDNIVKVQIEDWMDLYNNDYKPIKIVINKLPANTPVGADIYFSSDLNDWDPKASRFELKLKPDGTYYIDLPIYRGVAKFKFTRGNWETVEANKKGQDINDRHLDFSGDAVQYFEVESWLDLGPEF